MSANGTGKNDPLPVKSKAEAQAWAQQMTDHMAQIGGIRIDPSTVDPFFSGCTGRNGESAPDDRYVLMYTVKSAVPLAQHPDVVRKIRDMLVGEGLTVKGYQETAEGKPDAFVDAYHPNSQYSARASTSGGEDRMYLSIMTPCLMPPSASPAP